MAEIALLAAAGAGEGFEGLLIGTVLPMALILVVFWFLLIRPQQQRMKAHQDKINAVQKNDEVVTGGGLVGKVVRVMDDYVEIELGQGMRVKAVKSTLSDVTPRTSGKPAND
jgi:preprotein translocase subunit YajC